MIINLKWVMKTMHKKIYKVALGAVFALISLILTFSALQPAYAQNGDETVYDQESFDYILIIDESGSMKKNDPQNTRIDAAKLFVDLNGALDKDSRVCIIGFGEKVNVYFDLQDISGNEQAIRASLDQIKSSEPLTDMKAAFLKAWEILSAREIKNKAAIIFLTDGSLTLDDIPKEDFSDKTQNTQAEKEEEKPVRTRPSTGDDDNPLNKKSAENQIIKYQGRERISNIDDEADPKLSYLEKYKKDLLAICFDLSLHDTHIYPIAFTDEAQIQLLNDMAFITGTASYYAESAKDLKDAYLEIFGNITNRFLKTLEQKEAEETSGTIELQDYTGELVMVAVKNDASPLVAIEIQSADALLTERIQERTYEILKILDIGHAALSYTISGDAILIFEFARSVIIEPKMSYYLLGAQIPASLQLAPVDETDGIDNEAFTITYALESPDGSVQEGNDQSVLYDGEYFNGSIEGLEMKGIYSLEFFIHHIKTGSVSSKKIIVNVLDLGFSFKPLMPSETFEIIDSDTDIIIPVQASLELLEGSNIEIRSSDIKVYCQFTDEKGSLVKELFLTAETDSEKDSLIFEGSVEGLKDAGTYHADFFIFDPYYGENKIGTGTGLTFELVQKEASKETVTAESVREDEMQAIGEDESGQFSYMKIIIAASAVLGGIIIAVVAFLVLKKIRK